MATIRAAIGKVARVSRSRNPSRRELYKSLSTQSQTQAQAPEEPSLSLYCWGTNDKGSIPTKDVLKDGKSGGSGGAGNLLNRGGTIVDHPAKIDLHDAFGDENVSIRDVVCGPTSTAIITTENTVYTSGGNKFGQLGVGNKNDVLVPTILSPPDSSPLVQNNISKISIGQHMSAIIDNDGYLYTMGYNGNAMADGVGCLGHGYFPEEYLTDPTLVQSLVEDGCRAEQVVVGNSHMTVLTDEGEVLISGSGAYGRCGNLDPVDQLFLEPVELLAGETDICQIAGGKDYSLALTKNDGIIFAWGRNHKGQCGTGSGLSVEMYAMESMPVAVEGMLEGRKVVKMDGGESHAAALTDKGELFVWGSGLAFQPELVTSLGHTKIVDVSCGQDFTIALDQEGNIYSFGKGKTGVLGLASEKKATEPTLVEGLLGKKVIKIDAGWKHVACLAEENSSDS